jgi:hypothetical protein
MLQRRWIAIRMLRKTSLVLRDEKLQGNVISGVRGSCNVIQFKALWQLTSTSASLTKLAHELTTPWGEVEEHR